MPIEYWNAILSSIGGYFFAGSLILFLHCFYDTGFIWNRRKAMLLLIPAAIQLILGLLGIFNVPAVVVCFVISIFDYRGKKLVGLVRLVITYWLITYLAASIILIAGSYIIPDLNLYTIADNKDLQLLLIILQFLFFVPMFFALYFKVYHQGIVIQCGKRENVLLWSYLLILMIVTGSIVDQGVNSDDALTVMGLFFSIVAVIPPILVFSLRISNHYHQRTKLQEVYLQSELEHFRQYMHAQEETRRFRHDIRNNLLCMNEMVVCGDHEKLTQYLKDLLKITDTLSFKYVSGDDLLDSILNSKAQYMEQQNIRFELDGVLAGGLPWKPMDICAVFANAVDNAVEACQKVNPENRHISMNIKSTPQFWLISIENSVAEAVDTKKLFQKNGGYTSKSDSSRHGIGTYSMKQTVESYGAIMKAECTDQIFTLEIMIDKSK